MAAVNPNSPISTSREYSLIITAGGQQFNISNNYIQSAEIKPMSDLVKFKGISNIITAVPFANGHDIDLEIARVDSFIQDFWALFEASFYSGANIPSGSLTESIQESDGSITQYLYTNLFFIVESFGMIRSNELIVQKLRGFASQMFKVA
jgi:hypothetical protein